MKQSFRLSRAAASSRVSATSTACLVVIFALVLVVGAYFSSVGTPTTHAQSSTPTPQLPALPDTIVAQITNATTLAASTATPTPSATPTPTPTPSATPTPNFVTSPDTIVGDVSGDGRFVVIESTGNIATEKIASKDSSGNPIPNARNNEDGNREIFLFDYAQRRIFQITNTKSALIDATRFPTDTTNIAVEVSNNRPMLSRDGRFIVFSSNAFSASGANPANFDGNSFKSELQADGNQELVIYQLPPVPPVKDLSNGADAPFTDLTRGTFTRLTDTPASRPPTPGAPGILASTVDDNRDATINDDGSVIAFVSTRNLATTNGLNNSDFNPEVFTYNRLANTFTQVTDTKTPPPGIVNAVFNENPSISGDGKTIAFISNANIKDSVTNTTNNSDGNAEIYVAQVNNGGVTTVRQLTNTTTPQNLNSVSTNQLLRGRRMSRDGKFLAFESYADLTASGAPIQTASTVFVVDISSAAMASSFSFTQVGPRPTSGGDVLRAPTFTGDGRSLVFASALNFKTDASAPTATDGSDGLNPARNTQLFAVPIPLPSPLAISRLTPAPTNTIGAFQPTFAVSNTLQRIAFSINGTNFGSGNNGFSQAFYLLVPNQPAASSSPTPTPTPTASPTPTPSPNPIAYFTGATFRPVVAATASPTPTPSPSPSPTPDTVSAIAPGMLVVMRPVDATATQLAPSAQNAGDMAGSLSESRRFPLPIELNGVTVSINGAAAGLYFVSPGQINFVAPIGLPTTGTATVVINNNGTVIRSSVPLIAAQPDVFSLTNGAGGRARVFNVTDPRISGGTPEPFKVMTTRLKADGSGTETVPTVLRIILTGVRGVAATTSITVTVRDSAGKDTALTVTAVSPTGTPGFDQIDVTLPASLDKAGDVSIVVSVNGISSRSGDNAPRILIN